MKKQLKIDDLVKLTEHERNQFMKGELVYIDHPRKGFCYADWRNIYMLAIELTEKQKEKFTY